MPAMKRGGMFAIFALGAWLGCNGGEAATPAGDADGGTTAPAPDATGEPAVQFPGASWPTGDPSDHGLDVTELDRAAAHAESIGSQCLLVIRDGVLVYERYWSGTTETSVQKSWSIAKSFTSALIGIALRRGDIASIDDPAATYIPEWQNTSKVSITIRDLLSMSSGLEFDLISDTTWTIFSSDHTQAALDADNPDAPGSVWHYNNHAVQVLDAVLENATGMDPEDYAVEHLWGPIGMNVEGPKEGRTHWDRDRSDNPTMYMSVFSSCRDLGRFGYLYLHSGTWDGAEIVPNSYVADSLTPSQSLNMSYGLLWWLSEPGPGETATGQAFEGPQMDFAPNDHFSAQGLGQSFIDVTPDTRTVYVHVRPAPHEPATKLITDLAGTMEALMEDDRRLDHIELMRVLLSANR
jgi:CubicO group peptidase (beta-lactamase class C family)